MVNGGRKISLHPISFLLLGGKWAKHQKVGFMIGLRIRNDVSEPCSALAARILLVGRDLDRGQEVVKELKEAPWQLPGPPLARPWPLPLAPLLSHQLGWGWGPSLLWSCWLGGSSSGDLGHEDELWTGWWSAQTSLPGKGRRHGDGTSED